MKSEPITDLEALYANEPQRPLTVDQMMATISDAIVEIDRARAEVEKLTAVNARLLAALQGVVPENLCTTNPNIRDDTIVPMEVTMGELRSVRAAIGGAS